MVTPTGGQARDAWAHRAVEWWKLVWMVGHTFFFIRREVCEPPCA
jgi:hypothetical protein